MVNFNSEATIGVPASDIMRVLILERTEYFIDAWEDYQKMKMQNVNQGNNIVRSRLISLFLRLQATLKRRWTKTDGKFKDLEKAVMHSKNDKEILKAFCMINEELDKIKITKIDHKRDIDQSRVEEDNKEFGL